MLIDNAVAVDDDYMDAIPRDQDLVDSCSIGQREGANRTGIGRMAPRRLCCC